MQAQHEFRPRRRRIACPLALRVGKSVLDPAVIALDTDADARGIDVGQGDEDVFGGRSVVDDIAGGACRHSRADLCHRRQRGCLPAFELVNKDCDRAGKADQIDQGREGKAQRRMSGEHGADKRGRNAGPDGSGLGHVRTPQSQSVPHRPGSGPALTGPGARCGRRSGPRPWRRPTRAVPARRPARCASGHRREWRRSR